MKTFVRGAALLAAIALPGTAYAGTASSNLSVTANVSANCSVSTTAVAFGAVNTLSATAVDASGGVSVTCTSGTSWTAQADAGDGTGATFATRKMNSGANALNYSLFTDTQRTKVWGDGTASTQVLSNTGTGAAQSLTIYGRVPGGQNTVPVGNYSDSVSVTVTY